MKKNGENERYFKKIARIYREDKKFLINLLDLSSKEQLFDAQSEQINNQNIYKELKQRAELSNQKLQYLVIDKEQLELLKNNYISFAYFSKDEKYNIAFLPEKLKIIQKILYENRKSKSISSNSKNEEKVNQVLQKNRNEMQKQIR